MRSLSIAVLSVAALLFVSSLSLRALSSPLKVLSRSLRRVLLQRAPQRNGRAFCWIN